MNSIFEHTDFVFKMKFKKDFPMSAPTLTFLTSMFHPNVDKSGRLKATFLNEGWNETDSIESIIAKVKILLLEPDLKHMIHHESSLLLMENFNKYQLKFLRIASGDRQVEEQQDDT